MASSIRPADKRHFAARQVAPHPSNIMVACDISCRLVVGVHATTVMAMDNDACEIIGSFVLSNNGFKINLTASRNIGSN